jgi:hypothetical protein
MKKLWIGFIAVFVWVFIAEYILNMYIMMPVYQATSSLWRMPEEMKTGVIFIVQLIYAFFLTLIFSKGYTHKGVLEGIRYGFYVSMIAVLPGAYMTYATMPVPYSLALGWFLGGLLELIVAGVILALVFGKKPADTTSPVG